MGKIYFTRHGETKWNVEHKICGHEDIELTSLGHEQAIMLGQYIKSEIEKENIHIDEIIHSPLKRAKDTASHISEITGIAMRMEERLLEQDFGRFEGTNFCYDEFTKARARFADNYEFGESNIRVCQRIYNLVDELKKQSEEKTYLLVAHNGIARAFRSYFECMTNEEYALGGISNCQLISYDL